MIVAEHLALGEMQRMLMALSRGERLRFAIREHGPLAFTIERKDQAYVARDPDGRVIRRQLTFSELWRDRPRG